MKVFVKIANAVLTLVFVLILVSTAFMAFSARRSPDGISTIAGLKVLNVLSGSMEPGIHTGDVILVRPVAPEDEIREGDVITFRTKEKADMLITHRVIGIVSVNDQPAAYVTKGDANDSPDSATVSREQVLGRYEHRIPYFGYLSNFVRKPVGVVLLIILPGVIMIGSEIRTMIRVLKEEEAAKDATPPVS